MKTLNYIIVILIILCFSTVLLAEKVGVLKLYKGDVLIKTSASSKNWIKPKLNMKLNEDSIIKTGKNSEVNIKLKNGSIYKISSNKTVKLMTIMAKLKTGKSKNLSTLSRLKLLRAKLGKGGKSDTGSPTAVAGVRGADVSKKSKSPINPSDLIWEE